MVKFGPSEGDLSIFPCQDTNKKCNEIDVIMMIIIITTTTDGLKSLMNPVVHESNNCLICIYKPRNSSAAQAHVVTSISTYRVAELCISPGLDEVVFIWKGKL